MNTKILLIEDDIESGNHLKFILKKEKYDVIQAITAEESFMKYNECIPGIILCDVTMPELNGYQILEKFKRENHPFLTPFIFLNEHITNEDIMMGMQLGADDYINKKVNDLELLRSIRIRLIKYEALKVQMGKDRISKKYGPADRVFFHINGCMTPVTIEKIIYISAKSQYSIVHVEGGKKFIQRRALNEWLNILPQNLFIRIHRSTLVNRNYIKEIRIAVNNSYKVLIVDSETQFEVSRRLVKNVKNIFKSF
jgi:DNA-binding LytR/AlgR family response regulator